MFTLVRIPVDRPGGVEDRHTPALPLGNKSLVPWCRHRKSPGLTHSLQATGRDSSRNICVIYLSDEGFYSDINTSSAFPWDRRGWRGARVCSSQTMQ